MLYFFSTSIFLVFFFEFISCFGFPPTEGDYRHLYPSFCIGIKVNNNEHVLSYFMGMVEELRYPKDRMNIIFFASKDSGIAEWINQFPRGFYRLLMLNSNFENWYEEALLFGRSKSCGFLLIMDTDCFLLRDSVRQLMALDKVVVSPLLSSPHGGQSNVHSLLTDSFVRREAEEIIQVYYTKGPMLINLSKMDSTYLTFDPSNIRDYYGSDDPVDVFAHSAYTMSIPIMFSNKHHYGFFISSKASSTTEHMDLFGNFLAGWVSNVGLMPFPHSVAVPPWYPTPIKYGLDQIYLINLRRRPERLIKISEVLRLIGMEYLRFDAIDGQNLTAKDLSSIHFLFGFEDPYFKRPMKMGEIGCFLSHFKLWNDIIQQGYQRAIILEDDVRFAANGTMILKSVIEDLAKTHLDWDLIYLGRKRIAPASDEYFIQGHRFLSTVAYSHWTLGYMLSASGARKLLDANPLEHLLTLDEFLPIMYGQQPNKTWSAFFDKPDRKLLQAYAIFPSIVEPERYTNQPGYISDTEWSDVVQHQHTIDLHLQQPNDKFLVSISGAASHIFVDHEQLKEEL